MITEENQKFLLKLAREAIKYYLHNNTEISINPETVEEDLKKEFGTFVTITHNDKLRGCIGHILPVQPLYIDIIDNAISSAFKDPRFPPLSEKEFKNLKIEISILSIPKKLQYETTKEMFDKINVGDGIIIKHGSASAVFLPQVWDELPLKNEFLSHLCVKAGLPLDIWKEGVLEVEIFNVEKFKE